MADLKAKPLFDKNHFNHTMLMLVVLLLLGALVQRFFSQADSTLLAALWDRFVAWFLRFLPTWKVIAVLLAVASVPWTIYNLRKLKEVEEEEAKIYGPEAAASVESALPVEERKSDKWTRVLELTRSATPSDWRLAIIEADIMLDELLRAKGYPGDGVGEMLKSVDPTDMLTLEAAWEAHKVRNRIAHSGADFQLNERETKRVITLFELVFKEAQII